MSTHTMFSSELLLAPPRRNLPQSRLLPPTHQMPVSAPQPSLNCLPRSHRCRPLLECAYAVQVWFNSRSRTAPHHKQMCGSMCGSTRVVYSTVRCEGSKSHLFASVKSQSFKRERMQEHGGDAVAWADPHGQIHMG